MDDQFLRLLDAAEARQGRRVLRAGTPGGGATLARDGCTLINFSGNDYLGLSQHPLLIERARDWTARYGAGAGASRLVTGTLDIHAEVEAKLARWKGTEAALIFASGWQANAGVLPALVKAAGTALMFTDRLNHASLHHGCAAAGVRQIRFRHNDLAHLEELLAARAGGAGQRFIVTESVFSMDGDRADVERLAAIAARHDAFLYLDEAHATGVLGPRGAGLAGLAPGGVDLAMGTFSKAMGGFGAYIAGSRALCDWLVNASGSFIYSTAPPPAVLGAIDAALDLVPTLEAERAGLAADSGRVRAAFAAAGIDTGGSTTQIIPAIAGSAEDALAWSAALEADGILAAAIRPPTVPEGASRLRLTLSAAHGPDAIDRMIEAVIRLRPTR